MNGSREHEVCHKCTSGTKKGGCVLGTYLELDWWSLDLCGFRLFISFCHEVGFRAFGLGFGLGFGKSIDSIRFDLMRFNAILFFQDGVSFEFILECCMLQTVCYTVCHVMVHVVMATM